MRLNLLLIILLRLLVPPSSDAQSADSANFGKASSSRNMIASVHPLATDAGIDAFKRGGNAVDAAIATAVTLGVVDGYNSGIGGGCFILIRKPDQTLIAIDGREMAPQAAHRDMYLKNGKPIPLASQVGSLAVGVPGALAAYNRAIQDHGNLLFEDVIRPA
ncbi:MAG: gamma-glutamyltransferase, partial [Planctomycetota bacterium]